jgi:hypothetical protein
MRGVVLAALVLMLGCGGSTAPPADVNIAGTWNFGESLSDQSQGISYVGQGQIVISQSGNQFSGTYDEQAVLTTPNGAFDASSSGNINGGQVDGTGVSFQVTTCGYSGTTSGSPANRLQGQVTCDLDVAGTPLRLTGTWQAGR